LGQLVTTISCTKTAEPIEMLFRVWTWVAQGTIYLVGDQTPQKKGQFGGIMWLQVKYGEHLARAAAIQQAAALMPLFAVKPAAT